MTRGKKIALTLAAVSAVVLVFSAWSLARRIAAYYNQHPPRVFAFQELGTREFTYAGRPVRLIDENPGAEDWRLIVLYGEQKLSLRVTDPGNPALPGLVPHNNWMRLLRFADASGTTIDALQGAMNRGEVADRLVLVTRTPLPGSDPATYGMTGKRDWTFDFYEFLPAGGFEHQKLGFPRTRRPSLVRAIRGEAPKQPARPELEENTWQYQAAMMVMPRGQGPATRNFTNDGVIAAGWTLPAASISMLVLIFSAAFGLAPRRRVTGR